MKILGIAGTKESGKSSLAKYLFGYKMKELNLTDEFAVDENGELLVTFEKRGENNQLDRWLGILDIKSNSQNVKNYLDNCIHPFMKVYSWADSLKDFLMDYYGVPHEILYRNKNADSPIKMSAFARLVPKSVKSVMYNTQTYATGRECLHYMADILRSIDDDVFNRATVNRIDYENTEFAILDDCRRLSELQLIKARGGKLIYLQKHTHKDKAKIENEIRDEVNIEIFDYVLDNTELTPNECHVKVFNELKKWGWV